MSEVLEQHLIRQRSEEVIQQIQDFDIREVLQVMGN